MSEAEIHEIPIEEFTTPYVESIDPSTPLSAIQEILHDKHIRHIPVVESGKPIGIISDRDVKLIENLEGVGPIVAGDFMIPDPYCVKQDTMLHEVALEMSRDKLGSALVVDEDGKLHGIFTVTDALNALIEVLRGEA